MPAARRIHWARFRVAATMFAALLILGVLVVLMTGSTAFQPKDVLRVYMPDASGIGRNSPVRLNGIPIGRIRSVQLSNSPGPNRVVEVRIEIEHRYLAQVPEDSQATTTSENIQGDKYLDITRGKSSAPARAGGELAYQPAPDVMKTLDLAEFENRLRAIDGLLADIQAGKGSLGELVAKDDLYNDTVVKLAQLQKAARAATSTQEALGRFLYRDTLYQEIIAPIERFDKALTRIQRGEGPAGRLFASTSQYDNLRKRVADIRGQIATWNAGKGGAGEFLKDDAMYTRLNRQVASMIASVDALNAGEGGAGQLLRRADMYERLNGSLREMQRTLDDFRNNPQRYLRIELF